MTNVDHTRRDALILLAGLAAFPAAGYSMIGIEHEQAASFGDWHRAMVCIQSYADAVDRNDAAALVDVFADDAVYDYTPGRIMRGRREIAAGFKAATARVAKSCHLLGAPIVIVGDEPGSFTAVTSVVAIHHWKNSGAHTVYGRYHDVLRESADGRLRISRRKLIANLGTGEVGERYWLEHVAPVPTDAPR